jgi:hypothetical protein
MTAALGVSIILWLALRSFKLIASVFFSLAVGLPATAALGLLMVGSFNLISIDRTEQLELSKLRQSLCSAA